MNREILLSFIKKYYLDGLSESVKWVVTKDNIQVRAAASTSDCISSITLRNEGYLEPETFGVLKTDQLISMVSILDDGLTLNVNGNKLIATDKKYELQYQLADLSLIKSVPKIQQPEYDIDFEIQSDFISSFIQAKGALDKEINRVTFQSNGDGHILMVFGDKSSLSNKISLKYPIISLKKLPEIPFSSNTFKTLLNCNKVFDSAKIQISQEGLCRIYIDHGEIKCEYFIVRSMDV